MSKSVLPDPALTALHRELGIPASYVDECGLTFQADCADLVPTEKDVFDRQPYMAAEAFKAWQSMKAAAAEEDIQLQIVSAYRSVEYQGELFRKKMARGDTIGEILKVNAAPGFSEHHTGCALDITTPGFSPLEEEFEKSPAYDWLCRRAAEFGYSQSFPRANPAGMAYEPWHWKYSPG